MSEFTILESEADLALFSGKVNGLVAVCYENERPLQGLAGLMDWRFCGEISKYVRNGIVTGKIGEISYIPARKNSQTYHLLLIGGGYARTPGKRGSVPEKSIQALRKNLASAKIDKIGLSLSDFGANDSSYFNSKFEGAAICLVH